jgi:cobalt-zinc-cadmium efflux system protein
MLALVLLYIGVEIAGGLWSGSLALLADAGHMVSDAASMAITLFALRLARRPATPERTFGWHRAEILAAVVNGGALVAIALGILYEAFERWSDPPVVGGPLMMAVAAGGLLVNVIGLLVLSRGEGNLNLRAAWLHVLSDALGSAGAMFAGAAVWFWGWRLADPLASAAIALLVLHSSWKLLDDAVHVLMEGAPAHIDVQAIREALRDTPGVLDVHDLHVWTITSGMVSMSVHVVADEDRPPHEIVRGVAALLRGRFGIAHATIQVEPPGFDEAEGFHP